MTTFFATTAPGLEPITRAELSRLGLIDPNAQARLEEGGVTFQGGTSELYKANLHLRTASRVLVRLGDFYAAGFPELRKKAGRLPWDQYLSPGQPVALNVTCHKSRLYHSGAVAERVAAAIADRLGKASQAIKAGGSIEEETPAQLVIVRLLNDHVSISVDSSGALLHRRGYRLETAKAPLRETLAAAILLASGWDFRSPLLDPFCGSGTIAIEAACMALNQPPGINRSFAFMDWPGYNRRLWDSLRAAGSTPPEDRFPIIQASDRDAGAVQIAQANAERAGVAARIEFARRAVSSIEPPAGPGWVVTNPPYGIRVSPTNDLRNLYAQLGNVLRAKCPGWQAAVLCSDIRLLGQTGLRLDTSLSMVNGGVPVRLGRGTVPRQE